MPEQEKPSFQKHVSIDWDISKDLITRFATNIVAQRNGNEFIIMFFELKPPFIVGTPEEQQRQLEVLESVHAECVARIIVNAEKMPEFVHTLTKSLEQTHMAIEAQSLGEETEDA